MFSILLLGFIIGMQHAMEADHIAAVASLASSDGASLRGTVRKGAVWGVGHTLTLLLFCGFVLVADTMIPDQFARYLELAVGVMLVLLGADVIRRLISERVHFHLHAHGDLLHLHAHAHAAGPGLDHEIDPHRHEHPGPFPLRALFVGMMHGMAGSAALIILTLQTVASVYQGFLYILLFGAGSILGMSLLAVAITLPLRFTARSLGWLHNGLKGLVGIVTTGLGCAVIYRIGFVEGLLTGLM